MIPITDSRIEAYLTDILPGEDPFLIAMEERAKRTDFPIIDRLLGRFLYLLTRLRQPTLIVELGSGFGYSAYWFARAMSIQGKVVLTDYSEENMAFARRVYQETGLFERAEFRVGNALEIGRQYNNIDILFIDMDKKQYPEAITTMLPRLSKNALIIADNVLWHGRVAEAGETDPETEAIRTFNRMMFDHKEFFTSIVPLRDGVLLAYRIN